MSVPSALQHDSAHKHVTGRAVFIDDMAAPAGLLHVYFGISAHAHARIMRLDLDPVRAADGVVLVIAAGDIPGVNDISPTHRHDEPVFAVDLVEYHGQPLFAVAAETRDQARRAALLADVEYAELTPVLTVGEAAKTGVLVTDPLTLSRGDAAAALKAAPRRLQGQMIIGGQDHFYLEGQIAMALPGEDGAVTVISSTQHPTEVQHMVAGALGLKSAAVTVEVRRMGGAFGGKETQGNLFAVAVALVASLTGLAAKARPDRDDDMIITGKRHDFRVDYDVGFDDAGLIRAVEMTYAARCGRSSDLSGPVTDRALFHADNCYYFPHAHLVSAPLKTNTVSNTAFRGFGGPQGMLGGERLIEEIAYATGRDPLEIRKANLYGGSGDGQGDCRGECNVTPYHQTVEDNLAPEIIAALEKQCDYAARREAIARYNAASKLLKRGLALVPIKFGISFTLTAFNQAGALIHIYRDGSIHLNHGGTEMGQGLYIKVAQIVAEEFKLPLDRIEITTTTTGKVPNTSATAASSGTDLNGMAARSAARILKDRLIAFAAEQWQTPPEEIEFLAPGRIRLGEREIAFTELVDAAYMGRVSLSSTGFYKTPKIHWDRASGRGHPFYYFAYGAACSEVTVDSLTGEYRVDRVDILHDAGASLNTAIDIGQIEGGFVQGMGWLTTEELCWDPAGRFTSHAPSTYKIPACGDRPREFNVAILENSRNREDSIYGSKAVGEPPLLLAMSVLHALSDAVASVADHKICPRLDSPATPEHILMAIDRIRT